MSLLQLKHICKSFSGVYANENINLSVEKGEIHALLGEMCRKDYACKYYFRSFTPRTVVKYFGKANLQILLPQKKQSKRVSEWFNSTFLL